MISQVQFLKKKKKKSETELIASVLNFSFNCLFLNYERLKRVLFNLTIQGKIQIFTKCLLCQATSNTSCHFGGSLPAIMCAKSREHSLAGRLSPNWQKIVSIRVCFLCCS